ADVAAGRSHRGAAAGADRGRPRPAQHPPRRRGRAAIRPAGGLLGAPPAHPAAPARRPAGVGRPPRQPATDPVRARRRAGHRAAVHPPGQRPDADLRCLARILTRADRRGVGAPVPPTRGPGRDGRRDPAGGGGRAAGAGGRGAEQEVGAGAARPGHADLAAGITSSWSVPVMGPGGLSGVITVFRTDTRPPQRDELDLVTLYAGYAASAVERDRLLDQVTARNRVLETIPGMLETLAGPGPVGEGLFVAVESLRRGLRADEVALLAQPPDAAPRWRAFAGPMGRDPASASPSLRGTAEQFLAGAHRDGVAGQDGVARPVLSSRGRRVLAAAFPAPGGPTVLLASWKELRATQDETALMEDAAHSLRLALEREEAGLAHQEAAALRRSRELQRGFLSRMSHELRTPLTAIRGYASSLMQPDVTWDTDSQMRFLDRIAA